MRLKVKGRREDGEDMKETNKGRKCEGWLEIERCILWINVECWHYSNCCWVEVNLATLTCCGYYQILNTGVFDSRLSSL